MARPRGLNLVPRSSGNMIRISLAHAHPLRAESVWERDQKLSLGTSLKGEDVSRDGRFV